MEEIKVEKQKENEAKVLSSCSSGWIVSMYGLKINDKELFEELSKMENIKYFCFCRNKSSSFGDHVDCFVIFDKFKNLESLYKEFSKFCEFVHLMQNRTPINISRKYIAKNVFPGKNLIEYGNLNLLNVI